ncbi:MAG: hypothetical protein JWP12_2877 [Bacteroidetes bacterium]|nr:hypothetical protein [Bacteroidota bacterium]
MATGNVYVTVVDVGQGQCTFVEIYDDASTPKLIHALLFDCGTDKRSDEVYTNLDYIAAKALTLDTPGFDCIFFSHSDKDHISLTRYVLDKIWETTQPVVKEVVYGGAWEKYTKDTRNPFNILDYIVDNGLCASTSVFSIYSNSTNYDKTTDSYTGNLWISTDASVVVRKIAGNVLSDDPDWDEDDLDVAGKTAEALNRVSLIAGLYYAGVSYVICGDATNVTMAAVDGLFSTGTAVFNKNFMTTLPHHGSRATGFAVPSSKKASDGAIKIVDDFAAIMKSNTLSVSAYAKHSHPSLQLMNRFIPTITTPIIRDARLVQANAHYITANIDISLYVDPPITSKKRPPSWKVPTGNDSSFESNTNTFSTRYYVSGRTTFSYNLPELSADDSLGQTAAINLFACWRYCTAANGNRSFGGFANLATPLTSFTAAPTASLVTEREINSESEAEINSEKAKPVSVRLKLPAAGMPVSIQPIFRNRLKSFK